MTARVFDPNRPVEAADVMKQAREMVAEGILAPGEAEIAALELIREIEGGPS